MNKQTVQDIDIKGKRVLVRVDFNVPLDENNKITDDTRIVKSLETIRYCLKENAKLILMSHLGRPQGKPEAQYSLKPAAERLSQLIGKKVELLPDCVGPEAEKKAKTLKDGEVMMLENLREQGAADQVEAAVQKVTTKLKSLAAGKMGYSTSEVGDLVVQALDAGA